MAKHLVEIDERALSVARAELGTKTIKDTVNLALRRIGTRRDDHVDAALEILATAELEQREAAWR